MRSEAPALISALTAATSMEGVLQHRPQLLERYRSFYLQLWQGGLVPHRVLELCRLRIAQIHDARAELAVRNSFCQISEQEREALARGDHGGFSGAERAALSLAEEMPFNHHGISDQQVKDAAAGLGESGAVALLTALAFFDVNCRLKLVWAISPQAQTFDGSAIS